jgi:hypothetical protein
MRKEMMNIHNDRSLSDMKRETDRMLGRLPTDPLNPANNISQAISESAGSPPPQTPAVSTSATSTPVAATPVAEKPAAPEPQSPLHRDEP